jgi:hypothetical protein
MSTPTQALPGDVPWIVVAPAKQGLDLAIFHYLTKQGLFVLVVRLLEGLV